MSMTEQEKALAGLLYDPSDKTLEQNRSRCKNLCYEYNHLHPSKLEERTKLMKQLLGKTKDNFHIEPNFWCDYGCNIEIGDNFYSNHNLIILDVAKVTFGDNVMIAPNCGFHTAGHPIDADERNSGLEFGYPITVGNNVWFGASVTVVPGVTIGDNVVVAAGSVVTKDVPSNVIVAGNPAKVLREITDADKKKYHK